MSFWVDAGWQEISVFALGSLLILGGVIAFLGGLIADERRRKRDIAKFDARVGRDCFRDRKGIHR